MASAGASNSAIARALGVSRPTVILWRSRFAEGGTAVLSETKPGRGRKPTIAAAKIEAIVQATTQTRPPGQTHWSCRSMAKAHGVSPATVQRIWDARGLKPHRLRTFKLSNDPRFSEKLTDVVGLYLNPPEKALVLCVDEKSQIQARPHSAEPADEEGPRRHDDPRRTSATAQRRCSPRSAHSTAASSASACRATATRSSSNSCARSTASTRQSSTCT